MNHPSENLILLIHRLPAHLVREIARAVRPHWRRCGVCNRMYSNRGGHGLGLLSARRRSRLLDCRSCPGGNHGRSRLVRLV